MSGERRAQAALAVMLIIIFGGSPLIVVSERVFHRSLDLAMVLLASLPLLAAGIAVKVLETDAD
ncbi:hypothetical protein [Nocardioides immobilis]|uniref:hypothetical protein n=1 Tax=Nocardioides immobilis TaxID=2049295 RepID=UPI0011C35074|nr:hypothetical protein [Nocardioides immobilis]